MSNGISILIITLNKSVSRSGCVQVTFTDRIVEKGDVIVGADGVNSAVCRQWIVKEEFDNTFTASPVQLLVASYRID